MRSIVVLLFMGLFFAAALGNRFMSALFYWWLAIFRPQDWIYVNISALRISLVAGAVLAIGCFMTGRFPRIAWPIGWLILAFLGLETISTLTYGCGPEGHKWLEFLATMVLVLFLTDRLIEEPRHLTWLLFIVGCSLGFYAAKAGFASILQGGTTQYGADNLKGSFSGSNAFALGTGVIIFYMAAVAMNLRTMLGSYALDEEGNEKAFVTWGRRGLFAACGLSLFNIISLFSRGSTLATLFAIVTFFAIRPKGFARVAKLVPVALVLLLIVPLPDGVEERLASAFQDKEDLGHSASSRPHFWSVAALMAQSYPLGVGAKCYAYYYDAFDTSGGHFGTRRSVHGSHAQVLAETGYMGTMVWTALIIGSLLTLARVRARSHHHALDDDQRHYLESNSSAIACSIIVFTLGGTFYEAAHMELIWLSFIFSAALSRLSKKMIAEAVAQPAGERGQTAAPGNGRQPTQAPDRAGAGPKPGPRPGMRPSIYRRTPGRDP